MTLTGKVEMGPRSFHVESQIGDSIVVLETDEQRN